MNNLKTYTSIIFSILIFCVGCFGVYMIHAYVFSFSGRVGEMNVKLQALEESKKNIDMYKKILSKGSKEQEQINAYILSGDTVFRAITDIEKDGKKAGLLNGDSLGIISVTKRENATLKKLKAGEVVVVIAAEGNFRRVDGYIEALTSLPFVSHIEKINLNFSENKLKTKATITLVITELI